jgi:hypothetical protein
LALVSDTDAFLRAYDEQLRTDAETPSAIDVARLGPLRLVIFPSAHGFITYPHPEAADAKRFPELVGPALEHYRNKGITQVEWKSRDHDDIPGLREALIEHGFEPEDPESIMIGRATLLDVEVPLPDGVTLRKLTEESDVRTMVLMQDEAFGESTADYAAPTLMHRLALDEGMELWVAEAEGRIVSAGRVEPVAGTDFAGIWGGATLEAWRGRGIYRALTAVRARAAIAAGKTFINSDSTEYSRPILERSGLVKVSTTTPYYWRSTGPH